MKSCLVSLEALEIELVPALTAMTLDKSEQIVSYAKLLENYWKQQAKLLKEYVYCIIDPVAFVQVNSCLEEKGNKNFSNDYFTELVKKSLSIPQINM